MCTTLKEDLGRSAAEVVYGTTLCFPGEFLVPSRLPTSPGTFADLRQRMAQLHTVLVAAHDQKAFCPTWFTGCHSSLSIMTPIGHHSNVLMMDLSLF